MPDCYLQTEKSSSRPLNSVLPYSSRTVKTSPFPSWSALYFQVKVRSHTGAFWALMGSQH